MAKRRVNKTNSIKEDTLKKIEKTALEVFSETDFHKATMRQIAAKAGVSFETIYKSYGSKEGLLFYFIQRWLDKSILGIEEDLQGIEHIRERIRKFTWVQHRYYEQNPKVGIIIFMTVPLKTWMEDRTFKHVKMLSQLVGLIREGQEEGYIDSDIPPGIIVDSWVGAVTRAFTMWIFKKQSKSLMSDFNIRFNMFWKSIENRKSLEINERYAMRGTMPQKEVPERTPSGKKVNSNKRTVRAQPDSIHGKRL